MTASMRIWIYKSPECHMKILFDLNEKIGSEDILNPTIEN
jgi:hypothetical protein